MAAATWLAPRVAMQHVWMLRWLNRSGGKAASAPSGEARREAATRQFHSRLVSPTERKPVPEPHRPIRLHFQRLPVFCLEKYFFAMQTLPVVYAVIGDFILVNTR